MEIYNPDLGIYLIDLYPSGSVGNNVLPKALNGRRRRVDYLDRWIPSRILDSQSAKKISLEEGVQNLDQLLRMDEERLEFLMATKQIIPIKVKIENFFFNKVLLSPDDRLMVDIFNMFGLQEDHLISPVREIERHEVILAVLDDLERIDRGKSGRLRQVLEMSFGLVDWHPRANSQIGKIFNVSGVRISQIKENALGKIRRPGLLDRLRPYVPSGQL